MSEPVAPSGSQLSLGRQRELEADCQRVLLSVFRDLDEFDYQRVVGHFAEDGLWRREGLDLNGRAQILANLEQRPRKQVVRHLISNLIVEVQAQFNARASGYNTVFRAFGAAGNTGAQLPATINAPLGLWVLEAKLVCFRDVWLITELRQQQQFAFSQ